MRWAAQFQTVCLLDSNAYALDQYSTVEWILAVDALDFCADKENSFDALKTFIANASDKLFGFLSYDLKNQVEQLTSENPDDIGFPLMYFFKPRYIIEIKAGKVIINRNYPEAFGLYERIMAISVSDSLTVDCRPLTLTACTSKETYLTN